MSDEPDDQTASLMTPAKLAQLKVRPREAPTQGSAWLDQMAADAGSGHVRRLVDLRKQLEAQAGGCTCEGVAASLQALHGQLEKLDYAGLQPKGWLARATGKGKEASAGFTAQHARIGRAGEDLVDEVRALQKKHQAQASAIERTLGEVDTEVRALEKIMEQGARWLQDMRTQLKARGAQAADAPAQQQIAEDSARCDVLVGRLKQLRSASSGVQQVVERCRALARSRASVGDALQQTLDGEWAGWHQAVAPVAREVEQTGAASDGVPGAGQSQEQLQQALKQAGRDCRALETQEQALLEELVALQEPLQAAC
jgi:chromosome segregation ATPase